MTKEWYFAEAGKSNGPIPESKIIELIQYNRIQGETLLWNSSFDKWTPAIDTELKPILREANRERENVESVSHDLVSEPLNDIISDQSNAATKNVSFNEAISLFFKKFIKFSGRASRSEFWYAMLAVLIVAVVFITLDIAIFGSNTRIFSVIFNSAIAVPSLAVLSRRLHDSNRRAWWILLYFIPIIGLIVLIIFACLKGTEGSNRFGPAPILN